MKFIKTYLDFIIAGVVGIGLLALQGPVTNAMTRNMVANSYVPPAAYDIPKTWNLPAELNEISGLAWIDDNTFACVQDEDGIIFIFDTETSKITQAFKFAEAGDYEGIAINGKDAFVMRSDGHLYEIKNYASDDREIAEFQTLFSSKNNIESLTFDSDHQRLLTTPKDEDLAGRTFKNIYEVSLDQKTMVKTPVASIDLTHEKLKPFEEKKIEKTFSPSDIAIHPKTKDIYILEGKKPKLMIMNAEGTIIKVHELNKDLFAQPEGITFSNDGRLFISNEAKDMQANIMEVVLKDL